MPERPSVAEIVTIAWDWRQSGVLFVATVYYDDEHDVYYQYTMSELNAYDNRVLPALMHIFSLQQTDFGYVGRCLRRTVGHWTKPGPCLDDYGHLRYIHQIDSITRLAGTDNYLSTKSFTYKITTLPCGTVCAFSPEYRNLIVPDIWLEAHYPGSLVRIEIARTLDYDEYDVAKFIDVELGFSVDTGTLPQLG